MLPVPWLIFWELRIGGVYVFNDCYGTDIGKQYQYNDKINFNKWRKK